MLTRVSRSVGMACSLALGLTAFAQGCGSSEATANSDTDASSDASVADTGPSPGADAAPVPTYAVSGTVTGLAGNLVLSNNGGDSVTLTPADGGSVAFTFKTKVAKGGSYKVAVQTQPQSPPQTCTVTSGSGTIGDADVTNVAVSCTTNTFKIGGTIMGLAGSGLVLQNNLGDNVTIDTPDGGSTAGFTFPTSIVSGGDYSVTVLTNPNGPSQTCVVTGGAGKVAAGDVNTVAINCTTNTYTISGTVAGLVGTGLVLRNNNGVDLVVNSSSFAFPEQVTSGQSYSVTVQTDPTSPSQTCTVDASGSGTVTDANVNDVVVTCETVTATLPVTLSGLSGGSVVLTNNGGDDLTLSANGDSAFATAIPDGSSYDVQVKTNPAGQVCAVSSGAGTFQMGVTKVVVKCTPTPFSSYASEGRTVYLYKSPQCADLTANVTFCENLGLKWWAPKSQPDAQALVTNAFAIDSHHTWIQIYGLSTAGAKLNGYDITVDSPGCADYSAGGDWAAFRKWGCSFCNSDTLQYGAINKSCCWDSDHEYDWFVCE